MKRKFICLLMSASLLFALASCGTQTKNTVSEEEPTNVTAALSEEEIKQADLAFSSGSFGDSGSEDVQLAEISCFFTSQYASPEDIVFAEFLRYYPHGTILTASNKEEFLKLSQLEAFPFKEEAASIDDLPCPVHKYLRSDVSATLEQYTGCTIDSLKDTSDVLYLEEYDAYYNFTSDFARGSFTCTGGEKDGDTFRLWSDPYNDGTRDVLTIAKNGDHYYISAFEKESAETK